MMAPRGGATPRLQYYYAPRTEACSLHVHKMAQLPRYPLSFGALIRKSVFGIPGASRFVCVRPAPDTKVPLPTAVRH